MRFRKVAPVVMLALLAGGTADARKKSGVEMPDRIQVDGKTLVLNGMGLREATIFNVNVYVAGLYLETPSSDPAQILTSQQTKRIHMHFVRDVGRGDIVEAWKKGFANNVSEAYRPRLERRIALLNSWMTDMNKGDTMTFTYVPGRGTDVQVNGTRRGVIPGDDFGQALFGIWLGPKPPNKGLKRGLLGP